MDDEFISWDQLDLESVLGEWTDDNDEVLGHESEWDFTSTDELPADVAEDETTRKENTPKPKKPRNADEKKHFFCPLCPKSYLSTAGFRGHVIKKHDRPDLKAKDCTRTERQPGPSQAHLHQKVLTSAQDNQSLPKSKIPLTTNEQFESELPSITKKTLEGIRDDPIHNLSSSTSGGQMVKIAKNLLSVNLSALHAVLLTHLMAIITVSPSGQINIANILQRIGQMRYDTTFVSAMRQTLTTLLPSEISVRFLNLFLQRFISEFIKAYFARQNELLEKIVVANVDILTDNDKQVLFYICGYLIHALRKQYFRLKSVKARRLLECIDCLQLGNDVVNNLSSKWLDALDRGGLKRPCMKFFNLIVQVEKWVRDVVSVKQLKSDSLVNLKAKLLDYNLLKLSWQNITSGHSECSMVVLEHVLSLFLKVRGFAITKLYRKTLQKNVKPKKTKTDKSNKSLRNGLKSLNNLNSV